MRYIDIKELRKNMIEADMDSYTELANATGIDKSTISSIVKGEQKPSYDTLCKLIDALHINYDEIGRIFFANTLAREQN